MKIEEIVNNQKASEAAMMYWNSLPEEYQARINNLGPEPDVIDAYEEGVLYGLNNPNWIPVKDGLPTKRKDPLVISEEVLIHTTGGHYLSAVYDYQDKQWIDDYNIETLESDEVTHWMPIVPPRKGEEQ